ncbi:MULTISPECIES: adenylate/guanylate cyclase domain-containing protein [Bradyrhizobium]|uniref:adenylate/guanylate cyclase domain-containing protein n=1 Tax=Bradyrhizobium TaxID=374 RepID=UPI001EDB042E|nr:adenylate/guanylate cyclase domain-containing protein [Bradyrhizobium zhengyangense]MCG2645802.1 adenylate/guanylate cyclase domain-containing protein [Bradyrhizobium zhengyangense]
MSEARVERRLAAVLAADVAGYSRLMGADEMGTLAALKACRREIVDPAIARHGGRIVKTTGDGMLVEFASVVDAVTSAMAVQEEMAKRAGHLAAPITFRIGINVGDIILDGDDIFGDGVNIAARVESECEPGGVYLSDDAFRQVRGKTAFAFEDAGERNLKNIDRPVRLYAVRPADGSNRPSKPSRMNGKPLPLPDRPSIAVLPFQNMSGDPEQDYFADGVVEEIITALSHFKSLFVIARNSSFTYKGKAVDIKQVGRELGVRYVLEGSLRKAGDRVRITGQLIDASTGAHVWADKLDGDLRDIFALQDQVAEKVAAVIEPNIKRAEIEGAAKRRPESLNAYDTYLRALPRYYSLTKEGFEEALSLCYRALDMDSRYTAAARLAAEVLGVKVAQGWSSDVKADYAEAFRLGRLALTIDDTDPDSLAQWGRGVAAFSDDYDAAKDAVDRAVALNPNSARAWTNRGWTYRYMKDVDEAVTSLASDPPQSARSDVVRHPDWACECTHCGRS